MPQWNRHTLEPHHLLQALSTYNESRGDIQAKFPTLHGFYFMDKYRKLTQQK